MPHPPRRSSLISITLSGAALLASMTLMAAVPDLPSAAADTRAAQHAPAQAAAQHAEGPLLADAVAALSVATERREGYQRASFRHWIDIDRDGCSTRAEVLIEEAVTPPQADAACRLSGGSWYSYYDNQHVNDATGLDVDHLVPLAEAWDSGAYVWDAAQRQAYANDLDEPWHLVAVTARSNRSKADQDVATWQPPYELARCRYAAEWTAIKTRWQLSIDTAEQQALNTLATACPTQHLPTLTDDQR
ncbi:HNH endonuclease family protein [Nonomuraea sp. NPDC026600]|uniref:HNH endonuclease family protein n=1 Tax=Nonomuraea sp. NPDC026600 TaxID=3155363 RepID=UPI0033D8F416